MRSQRPQPLSIVLGLLALGWAAASVGIALGSDGESVGLSALSPPEMVLMSCAADVGAGYSALTFAMGGDPSGETPEPLWCENPESPHCQPGAPDTSHQKQGVGPVRVLGTELSASRTTCWYVAPARWSRPAATQLVLSASRQRLERPPRVS